MTINSTILVDLNNGNQDISESGQIISVTGSMGQLSISGSNDTIISSSTGIVLTATGNNESISVSGGAVSINANGSSGDSISASGSGVLVNDGGGLSNGGISLSGKSDSVLSNQRIESFNATLSGTADLISASYTQGNFSIIGDMSSVFAAQGNYTIAGSEDNISSYQAETVVDTGNNDDVLIEAAVGQNVPVNLFGNVGTTDTTPGTAFTITGSGASITTYTNNNSVSASGGNDSVNMMSYGDSVSASGAGSVVETQANQEYLTISGANSTVNTSSSPLSFGSDPSTVPSANVSFTSGAVGSTYETSTPSVPASVSSQVSVNIIPTADNVTIYGSKLNIFDTIGGSNFNVSGADTVNIAAPSDVVTLSDNFMAGGNSMFDVSGQKTAYTTINVGNDDVYNAQNGSTFNQYDWINVNGDDASGVIYQANHDTLYEKGSGNLFVVSKNVDGMFAASVSASSAQSSDTLGSSLNVDGNNTLLVMTDGNTINAVNGASVLLSDASGNTITGSNSTFNIQGDNNLVSVTGSDTLTDDSGFSYGAIGKDGTVQNQIYGQSGSFNLGGQDSFVQGSGTANVTLFGGNRVTLAGSNDQVTVNDQVYGSNQITDNGTGTQYQVNDIVNSQLTINAAYGAFVRATDNLGSAIGITNNNSNEKLTFIGGSTDASTVLGAGGNVQLIFESSANGDIASGGVFGNNNLNGGSGSNDLFMAGGNNDVLIGGSGGSNTLVSAAGNETLTGSQMGNDVFSILGGGGQDALYNMSGNTAIYLGNGLSVTQEAQVAGGMSVSLSDGTNLTLYGVSALHQVNNILTAAN